MHHIATALMCLCVLFIVALVAGKFVAFGDGPNPMSEEELDRAALNAFYREIAVLVLGMLLGASLFCLGVGVSVAINLTT